MQVAGECSVHSLSSGEQRRVALALSLAYVQLLDARGLARCDTLVLDEPHTHLDGEGVAALAATLRALRRRCVVVVAQAGSALLAEADRCVEVVALDCGSVVCERAAWGSAHVRQ
jgi:DNA repair exonuclease SbcCD ATPase subunit